MVKPDYVVVKVQQALTDRHRVLVYDKSKRVMTEVDNTKELKAMLKEDYKSFWKAKITKKKVELIKKVTWREW